MTALTVAAVALLATAAAADQVPGCDVSVRFGSFAMGIDHRAAAAVDSHVAAHPGVLRASRTGRGIEGEYALCLQARSAADAATLLREIQALVSSGVRAPVAVTGTGATFEAPILRH